MAASAMPPYRSGCERGRIYQTGNGRTGLTDKHHGEEQMIRGQAVD